MSSKWSTPIRGSRTFKDLNKPPRDIDLKRGRSNLHIEDVGFESDIRPVQPTGFNQSAYDSLVNLVLNHKMELKKMPSLMTEEGAAKYANNTRDASGKPLYRLKTNDINGDGENDIILYNRAGKPVIVNGYKAKPSDFGAINAFRQLYPNEVLRKQVGGMDGWVKSKYGFKSGEYAWDDHTVANESVPEFEMLSDRGYRKIPKPQTKKSFNTIFASVIKNAVKDFWNAFAATNNYSPEISKLVSPLTLYRILFMLTQEAPLMQKLGVSSYSEFKEKLKGRKSLVDKQREQFIALAMKGAIDYKWVEEVMNSTFDGIAIIIWILKNGAFPDAEGNEITINNDNFPVGWQNDPNTPQQELRNKKAFFSYARELVDNNLRELSAALKKGLVKKVNPKVQDLSDEEN